MYPLRWPSATCEESEMFLKEKWISLLFHIQNKCYWTGYALYHQCCKTDLSTEKECSRAWRSPEFKLFLALLTIGLDETVMRDMV